MLQKCKVCWKELPLSDFNSFLYRWKEYTRHQCTKCYNKLNREKNYFRRLRIKAEKEVREYKKVLWKRLIIVLILAFIIFSMMAVVAKV